MSQSQQLRTAEKRAPSTPLTLVNAIKRKLPTKPVLSEPHTSDEDSLPGSTSMYKKEMIDLKFETWLTNQKLQDERELRVFLEIERKAQLGLLN